MIDSFTLYDRNFFDMDKMQMIKDVNLADYGVYIGREGGGLWSEILVPNSKHYTTDIQGLDGQIFNGINYTERRIQIPLFVQNVDENNVRDVQEILTVTKPLKLQLHRKPYKYIYVVSDGQVDFNYVWHKKYSGLFVVNYVAYNPYYESFFTSLDLTSAEYNDPNLYNDSGMLDYETDVFPSVVTIDSNSKIFQLYNGGNAEAKVIIKIKNNGLSAIDNIIITNTSSGELFTITTINSSETIVLDGIKGRVTDYPETKLLSSRFKGDFVKIQPKINSMQFSTTDTDTIDLEISFEYRYTYL